MTKNTAKHNRKREALESTDISDILGISRSTAYDIMRSENFPSFRLVTKNSSKGRFLVMESDFYKWLDEQKAKKASL